MLARRTAAAGLAILAFVVSFSAQSSSQEYPTAIVSSELSGTIKARDVGDSRLTTHYYAFDGEQGDIFINLVTRNFTGDIDVFTANGLKPLTKIVVYADQTEAETGRVIYLRKPERLLLRVQGRTPNDDDAAFRLKFGGSFLAIRSEEVPSAPELPKVNPTAGNRVNSVGTVVPRPVRTSEPDPEKDRILREPDPRTTDAEAKAGVDPDKRSASAEKEEIEKSGEPKAPARTAPNRRNTRASGRRTENATDRPGSVPAKSTPAEAPVRAVPAADPVSEAAVDREAAPASKPPRTRAANRSKPAKAKEEPKPDPLASISLVVQFKNGDVLEKRMSEVFKFTIDKGVLVVILKDGSVTRYPIVDVAKLTIE